MRGRAERLAAARRRRRSRRRSAASAAARCRWPSSRASPARSRSRSRAPLRHGEPPVVGVVRDGRCLLDCRTLADDEVDEVAAAVDAHAADRRHRRSHRPRQDVARPRADRARTPTDCREEQRARHLDRPRLRAARAARRHAALRSSTCPGTSGSCARWSPAPTGIDLFLLVIDAGEGARPQTHEHLAILRLLGVERGVVAVTKSDLGRRRDARARARTKPASSFLAPTVVAVSAHDRARGSTSCVARCASTAPVPGPSTAQRRPGSTSTASSRCAGSAPSHRDALVGLDRRRRRAALEPARGRCASAACRCTTNRSSR